MSDTIETSAGQVSEESLSLSAALKLWREHGGSTFGPHVEHVSMKESDFLGFCRELLSARTSTAPVAWRTTASLDTPNWCLFETWQEAVDQFGGEFIEPLGVLASPPPPQPGVRVTEALRELLDYLERTDEEGLIGHAEPFVKARAALTASIPDSGEPG